MDPQLGEAFFRSSIRQVHTIDGYRLSIDSFPFMRVTEGYFGPPTGKMCIRILPWPRRRCTSSESPSSGFELKLLHPIFFCETYGNTARVSQANYELPA